MREKKIRAYANSRSTVQRLLRINYFRILRGSFPYISEARLVSSKINGANLFNFPNVSGKMKNVEYWEYLRSLLSNIFIFQFRLQCHHKNWFSLSLEVLIKKQPFHVKYIIKYSFRKQPNLISTVYGRSSFATTVSIFQVVKKTTTLTSRTNHLPFKRLCFFHVKKKVLYLLIFMFMLMKFRSSPEWAKIHLRFLRCEIL